MERIDLLAAYARVTGGPDFKAWAETLAYMGRNPEVSIERMQRAILLFTNEALHWAELKSSVDNAMEKRVKEENHD